MVKVTTLGTYLACFIALIILTQHEAKASEAEFTANINLSQRPWGFYPDPIVPANNPLTDAKVALGKRLFSETALSVTGQYSCSSCHQEDRHFTDGLPVAVGATGELHTKNTPTLYNTAYNASFGWQNIHLTSLEQQHIVPLTNANPVELGYSEDNLTKLADNAEYARLFSAAFADEDRLKESLFTTTNLTKALASYVRTLVAPPTAFEDYLFEDNRDVLSHQARSGMDLFFSDRLGCSKCHASLSFSGPVIHKAQQAAPVFHVTGVGGSKEEFRAPTLRQISKTAPYMHNGSIDSLEGVIEHYEQADQVRLEKFKLSHAEKIALLAFLRAL